MPYADPEAQRAYWRKYDRARRQQMRDYLGGVCVVCGTSEDLQIDHIDRDAKEFDPTSAKRAPWERLVVELDKCQLLCEEHHLEKGRAAGDVGVAEHGTSSRYTLGCRCEDCSGARRAYDKARYQAILDGTWGKRKRGPAPRPRATKSV